VTFEIQDSPLWMTMRTDLDDFLLKQAQAELRQGDAVIAVDEKTDRVIVRTQKGREFAGRYLIGADGPNSVVAHSLGLRRDKTLLGAIEVEAPVPPEIYNRYKDGPVMIFGEIDMGYLRIFPKAEHLSIGIGALHPRPGELQAALSRVMDCHQIPLQGLPMHGHAVPIRIRKEKIFTARTLLIGDAAGLVDPAGLHSGGHVPDRPAAALGRQLSAVLHRHARVGALRRTLADRL
jgi:flavin-dependent dehydrogenase